MKDLIADLLGRLIAVLLVLVLPSPSSVAQSQVATPIIQAVAIGKGITLRFACQNEAAWTADAAAGAFLCYYHIRYVILLWL
jgi:hypothetical protein